MALLASITWCTKRRPWNMRRGTPPGNMVHADAIMEAKHAFSLYDAFYDKYYCPNCGYRWTKQSGKG